MNAWVVCLTVPVFAVTVPKSAGLLHLLLAEAPVLSLKLFARASQSVKPVLVSAKSIRMSIVRNALNPVVKQQVNTAKLLNSLLLLKLVKTIELEEHGHR